MLKVSQVNYSNKYLDSLSQITTGSNPILKYNTIVSLTNLALDFTDRPASLKLVPEFMAAFCSLRPFVKILIEAILFICCAIPFVNIISWFILLIFYAFAVKLRLIVNKNTKAIEIPFDLFAHYERLCIDSDGEEVLCQVLTVEFQQFERENLECVKILSDVVDMQNGVRQYFFVVYRKGIEVWWFDMIKNTRIEVCILTIGVLFGFIIVLAIDIALALRIN